MEIARTVGQCVHREDASDTPNQLQECNPSENLTIFMTLELDVVLRSCFIPMSQSPEDEDRISWTTRVANVSTKFGSTVRTCLLCKHSVKYYNKEFCVIPDKVSLSFLRVSRSRVKVRGVNVSRKNGSSPALSAIISSTHRKSA